MEMEKSRILPFVFLLAVAALILLSGCSKKQPESSASGAFSLPSSAKSSEQPPALPAESGSEGAPPAPPAPPSESGAPGESGAPLLG